MLSISRFLCTTFLAFYMCFSFSSEDLRYKDYEFTPVYGNAENSTVKDVIKSEMREWHSFREFHSLGSGSGSFIALYSVDLKEGLEREWASYKSHKKYTLKKKLTEEDWSDWGAISYISKGGQLKNIVKVRDSLFSSSVRLGREFHGCIEEDPIFYASLIEGSLPYYFVVTGSGGMGDSGVVDNIVIHVVSDEGERVLSEALLLSNFTSGPGDAKVGAAITAAYSNPRYEGELKSPDGFGRKRVGKIFIGDLDSDNNLELLFWYRTFKSKPFGEMPLFEFEKDSFKLYKEVQGRFKVVPVNLDVVTQMLEDNELVWDKGFPEGRGLCEKSGKSMVGIDTKSLPVMPIAEK